MHNAIRYLFEKGGWLYVLTFIIAPLSYVIRVLISQSLEPYDVGLLYSVLSLVMLISVYNDRGLSEALRYFIPRYVARKQRNRLTSAWVMTVGAQLVSMVMLFCLAYYGGIDWLARVYFADVNATPLLWLGLGYFVCINIYEVVRSTLLAFHDTRLYKLLELVLRAIICLGTIWYRSGGSTEVVDYMLVWLWGSVVVVCMCVGIIYYYRALLFQGHMSYDASHAKTYTSYAFWTFLALNAGMLLGQIDQQMVVAMLGPEQAGFYTNYYSLYMTYALLFGPLLTFLTPMLTTMLARDEHESVRSLFHVLVRILSVLSLAFGIGLVVRSPWLAQGLFGSVYAISGDLLTISGAFVLTNVLVSLIFAYLAAVGRMRHRVLVLAVAAGANIVGNYILIPIRGIYGVVVSSMIGQVLMLGLSVWQVDTLREGFFSGKGMRSWLMTMISLLLLLCIVYTYYHMIDGSYTESMPAIYFPLGICMCMVVCIGVLYKKNIYDLISRIRM